jgi:hypothetical protein
MIPDVKDVKIIPRRNLKAVWNKISDKPLPDILAYVLPDDKFLETVNLINQNKKVTDTRIKEYGLDFDNKYIEACTFEFEGQMIVFVKKSANLGESLYHELKHVSTWKHEDKHPDHKGETK